MNTNIPSDLDSPYEQGSEDQLLSEARSGNQRAFGELCVRHSVMLKQRIFRIVRNFEDAEDVLQETFLSAYRHLDTFRGTCKISTWMTKIGINMSLMLLRKRRIRFEFVSDQVGDEGQTFQIADIRDPAPNPEQLYRSDESRQRVRFAIEKLPPPLHWAMALYYGNDHGIESTAKTLGITVAAAKSRMMRARNRLRGSLNAQWNKSRENCKNRPKSSRTRAPLVRRHSMLEGDQGHRREGM